MAITLGMKEQFDTEFSNALLALVLSCGVVRVGDLIANGKRYISLFENYRGLHILLLKFLYTLIFPVLHLLVSLFKLLKWLVVGLFRLIFSKGDSEAAPVSNRNIAQQSQKHSRGGIKELDRWLRNYCGSKSRSEEYNTDFNALGVRYEYELKKGKVSVTGIVFSEPNPDMLKSSVGKTRIIQTVDSYVSRVQLELEQAKADVAEEIRLLDNYYEDINRNWSYSWDIKRE